MVEYIIDGCNFVKTVTDDGENDFESEKRGFVSRLQAYANTRQVGITVVFDSRRPSSGDAGKVKVIHTRDADRKIADEVRERQSPPSVTVVSNDRALLLEVRDYGAKSMSVLEFARFLSRSLSKGRGERTTGEKPSPNGMSREDILWWKKELGLD